MDELRVVLVGAGLIAGVHARAYATIPGVEVVAVVDPVLEKATMLADSFGAQSLAGLDGLDAVGHVDVIDVCSPPHTHADLVLAALKAGRHVFCEKPIARTLEDAELIVAAAESAAGILMVGHVSRYEADHATARALVTAGEIGELRMVTHSTTSGLPGWTEGGWLTDHTKSGGPLVDQAVHSFDYVGWLTGSPPVRVTAVSTETAAGPDTYALASVRYADETIARIEVSWGHPPARGFKLGAELVGTGGRLTWTYDSMMAGVLHRFDGPATWYDVLGEQGFRAELADFVDAIRTGRPSPVPAIEATAALRVALAAAESARTGRTIDLPDKGNR